MQTTACENFVRKACQSRFFFCEKEFASIEILIQIITMTPPNPSDNSISRRTFVKTSTLTVGAATLLCQGVSLGQGMSPPPPNPCNKNVSANPDLPRTNPRTYTDTLNHTSTNGKDYFARIDTWTTPTPGDAKAKKVKIQVNASNSPATLDDPKDMDIFVLDGAINDSNCTFAASTSRINGDKQMGDPWYIDEGDVWVETEHFIYDKVRKKCQTFVRCSHSEEAVPNGLAMKVKFWFAERSVQQWRVAVDEPSEDETWHDSTDQNGNTIVGTIWDGNASHFKEKTVEVFVSGTRP